MSRQEFTACLNLFLKMFDILFLIGAFGMNLGVACAADAEIKTAFLDFTDKVNGKLMIPTAPVLVLHFRRNITTKCKNVLYPTLVHLGNSLVNGRF